LILYVADSPISGHGVFSKAKIPMDEKILRYSGPILGVQDIKLSDEDINKTSDRYVQIGRALYMGPSGQMDDWVNHRCNPNAGLRWFGDELWLISIWDIELGQEITFDYSTSIGPDDPWTMSCRCGCVVCRKIVGAFHQLPVSLRQFYQSCGVDLVNHWVSR